MEAKSGKPLPGRAFPFTPICRSNFYGMNWTSTKVPLWQSDCENFHKAGPPFELRDVSTAEHFQFVSDFALRNHLRTEQKGAVVKFESDAPSRPGAS